MKKLLALALIFIMMFTFVGCKRGTDLEEIAKREKIVVGITNYYPLAYKENGKWTGFDVELARSFAKKLGVEAEFVEIKWSEKYNLLNEYEIDCIWNAMTIIPELQTKISVSDAYIECPQVMVMKADVIGNYHNGYDIRKLNFALEKGSAGDRCIEREGFNNVAFYNTQYDALKAVSNGKKDVAIVDLIIAKETVGKDKKYSNLAIGFDYSAENAGVGFRLNSDLVEKVNEFFGEVRDGQMIELANKYGLTLY